jgi:predicted regulator of Ras-like GTPase activity (Roadblock/LC7/MglB family)
MTYKERQEMNALSKELYGVSSRWQKTLRKGELEPAMVQTSSGKTMMVKVAKTLTEKEVKDNMSAELQKRKDDIIKAAVEKIKTDKEGETK